MNTDIQMDAATSEQTAAKPARKPRTRIPHERSQVVHALADFARAIGAPFNVPSLEQLAELTQDEYEACRDRLITVLGAGIAVIAKAAVPPYDVQLATFRDWQRQHGEFFEWSDAAMDALRRKLDELGPGCEIVPTFAMSVQVKLPSGKLTLLNRRGEETKG